MQKQPAETYDLLIGGNTVKNCGQVITYRGKNELLRLRDGKDSKLLVDCTVKDSSNHTIIKLANNKPVFIHESLNYEELENGIIVKDKNSEAVYLEFRQLGPREIKVNGIFFVNGIPITATDEFLDVGGMRISGSIFEGAGSFFGIG